MWNFLGDAGNANAIMAIAAIITAFFAIPFGWLFRKYKASEKESNYLGDELKNTKSRLAAAQSQLRLYDPNIFVQRLEGLKEASADQKELQKASEDYFFYQNKAITAAASHLAEGALLNTKQDGEAALHEAKRWLELGLSATPRHHALTEQMEKVNKNLNAAEHDIPEDALDIDPSLNFEQLNRITKELITNAKYALAEFYAKRTIELVLNKFGESDPKFGTALNNLAALLEATDRFEEAEPLYRQALEHTRIAMGEDHPEFSTRLNNLAALLMVTDRFEDAEPLFRQALKITRIALGEDHPDFRTRLNNLALLLRETDRFEEAEPLLRRALQNTHMALGEDHPNFGTRLSNLAGLLEATGRFEEAEPLYRQALENTRNTLGEDHPNFGANLNNLASLLKATGRFEEAEPLFRQTVSILENSLGSDHPNTKTAIANYTALQAKIVEQN